MFLEQVQVIDQAITSRHSVRAFLDKPIDLSIIKDRRIQT